MIGHQLGEVVERATHRCDHHGDFEALKIKALHKRLPDWWTKCPECNRQFASEQSQAFAAPDDPLAMQRRAATRVPKRYWSATTRKLIQPHPQMGRMASAVMGFVRSWTRHLDAGTWLGLIGKSGTGKTHVGCAIVNDLAAQGESAQYWTQAEMMGGMRAAIGAGGSSVAAAEAQLVEPNLLVVDEVGRCEGREWTHAQFAHVLDLRYRERKPTVLLSNLGPSEFKATVGEAVVDRLTQGEGRVLVMQWPSLRADDYTLEL